MRICTWNHAGGPTVDKLPPVLSHRPSLIALQEAPRPIRSAAFRGPWHGNSRHRGIALRRSTISRHALPTGLELARSCSCPVKLVASSPSTFSSCGRSSGTTVLRMPSHWSAVCLHMPPSSDPRLPLCSAISTAILASVTRTLSGSTSWMTLAS